MLNEDFTVNEVFTFFLSYLFCLTFTCFSDMTSTEMIKVPIKCTETVTKLTAGYGFYAVLMSSGSLYIWDNKESSQCESDFCNHNFSFSYLFLVGLGFPILPFSKVVLNLST